MPQWDRHWLLGILGSLVLLAASVTLSLWYLASLFALPQQFGLPPLNGLGEQGGTVIWVGGIGGLTLFFSSQGARRRGRARQSALGGGPSGIPLATVAADPACTPDATHLPLALPWRRRPRGREWAAASLMTLIAGSFFGFLFALPALLGIGLQTLGEYMARHSIADLIATVLLLAFDICLAVAGLVALVVALTSRLGPEYGVVADDEGIRALHLKGPGPRLRWSDVRLVEVAQCSSNKDARIFTVYGPRASVYWWDFKKPPRKRRRPEISREEFEGRQQALLALLASRTGLQPRTFSTQLVCDDELAARPLPTHRYRVLAYGIGYGLAGVLLLLAAAVLVLPLTHNPLLDGYAALTSALAGITLVVIVTQALRPARTSSPQHGERYTLPIVPRLAADPMDVTYRRPFTGRLQDAAIGLVLLCDAVPAVLAQVNLPAVPPLAFATHVVALLLFLVAFIGLFALFNAIGGRRTTLTASAGGLSERAGRTTTLLSWGAIVSLRLELEKGAPDSFTALGRDGETISWPARGVIWQAGHPGLPSITPEELAAIVVQQSGVHLTVKDA